MAPLDGEDRFTSAITPTRRPWSASRNDGTLPARRAMRSSSAARGARVAARARAPSVNSPRMPVGGVQPEKACASVDLRLTWEFGKCSVGSADPSFLKTSRGKGYVAHKAPTGDSDLPRHLFRRARLRAKLRGDRDAV